ncbi:MAG: phosphoribosylglycinamide formyltransferase [Alphaproteobacteria bacterium]
MTLNIVIMGSTRGSSSHALMQEIADNKIDAKISCVVSNKVDAPILDKAKQFDIPTFAMSPKGMDKGEYDKIVIDEINKHNPDLILMVGYMRIVSGLFINSFENKILNVHPSLLPKHGGLMDLDVHQSVLNSGDTETGCTIHYVIEVVDSGENVLQLKCNVENNDTAESLKAKVQVLESKAWIEVIKNWKQ